MQPDTPTQRISVTREPAILKVIFQMVETRNKTNMGELRYHCSHVEENFCARVGKLYNKLPNNILDEETKRIFKVAAVT